MSGFTTPLLHSLKRRAQRNLRFNQTHISMRISSVKVIKHKVVPVYTVKVYWGVGV
jgi:hypothetical protein